MKLDFNDNQKSAIKEIENKVNKFAIKAIQSGDEKEITKAQKIKKMYSDHPKDFLHYITRLDGNGEAQGHPEIRYPLLKMLDIDVYSTEGKDLYSRAMIEEYSEKKKNEKNKEFKYDQSRVAINKLDKLIDEKIDSSIKSGDKKQLLASTVVEEYRTAYPDRFFSEIIKKDQNRKKDGQLPELGYITNFLGIDVNGEFYKDVLIEEYALSRGIKSSVIKDKLNKKEKREERISGLKQGAKNIFKGKSSKEEKEEGEDENEL